MRRLACILVLSCIPGTFIVRTYRMRYSNEPLTVEGQYILDKIEIDDSVLRHAPDIINYERMGGQPQRLETVLTQFSALAGLNVVVRWDALAKEGIERDTLCAVPDLPFIDTRGQWRRIFRASMFGLVPLAVRCRRHIVEISSFDDFESDTVIRHYPVSDLIGKYAPSLNEDHSATYLSIQECFGAARDHAGHRQGEVTRLEDGTLEVRTRLELQVQGYEFMQHLRQLARQKQSSP
jgi:hypothetical protein